MDNTQKIEWNRQSAADYGWTPEWFGCTDFNLELLGAIKSFQHENGLKPDALCGSATYRRIWTERNIEETDIISTQYSGHIIWKDELYPIKWDKVVTYKASDGLVCNKGTYTDYGSETRHPKMFVTHWDVTLSSSRCARILNERGISVHFCIDNDGTIYQLVDMNNAAWHAGNRAINHNSIGVEISDGYNLRWQSWYEDNGFGPRPIMKDVYCHGRKLDPFLGFYPIQLQALTALYSAISEIFNIPLVAPAVENGVDPAVKNNTFSGFCSHYHITTNKIDCAGLDITAVCSEAITLND